MLFGCICYRGKNETKYSRMDQVKFVEDSVLKMWIDMVCLSRPYHFKFLKAQILLGPFLNILSQMLLTTGLKGFSSMKSILGISEIHA